VVVSRATEVVDRLKGPVVPVNICFADDHSVDYEAMRRYVDWLCEQRVPVVLLTYGSSEFSVLSASEIWKLTELFARTVDGRSLFVTSTGYWSIDECREFLRHADAVGADAVKVQINPWLGQEREVLVGYFDAIRGAAGIPLLLWGAWPDPYPIATVRELAARDEVVGIKNDGDPFYAYYDLLRATADQSFAVISGGQMRNFMLGHPLGGAAYLCTVAPFRPDLALQFYGHLQAGEVNAAWAMVERYEDRWLPVAVEHGWLESVKVAMELHGLVPNARLGRPRPSLEGAARAVVQETVKEVFGDPSG
jgi:4-hydroxy-tetrahydrodipicolinate synthase